MHKNDFGKKRFLSFARVLLTTTLILGWSGAAAGASEDERRHDVYLTKKEAFQLAFPDADEIKKKKIWLTDTQRSAISGLIQDKYDKRRITYYVGLKTENRSAPSPSAMKSAVPTRSPSWW